MALPNFCSTATTLQLLTGVRIIDVIGIDEVPQHIRESGEHLYQPPPELPLEEPEDLEKLRHMGGHGTEGSSYHDIQVLHSERK